MPPTDLRQQLRTLRTLLASEERQEDPEVLEQLIRENLTWLALLPERGGADDELKDTAAAFADYIGDAAVRPAVRERPPFESFIPPGWLQQYIAYTRQNEAPTVFHFFSALTALGALLCRRVYFDKGHYKVHTNMATVFVAPSGICRKSTATNIAVRLVRELAPSMLLSSKLTPEALIAALAGRDLAVAMVHAPELSVFIGKQRYLEGLIQILTDLLDCPDVWSSETIMRGQNPLYNVGLSLLGASTPDWLVTSVPKDAWSGGFWSRILTVPQITRERVIALPERYPEKEWLMLLHELGVLSNIKGTIRLTTAARDWYVEWYNQHQGAQAVDEKFAGYQQRKPDHLLRVAMLLHLSKHAFLIMDVPILERALAILNWVEQLLPETFQKIALSGVGEDHVKMLQIIKHNGGMDHSALLRKMYNMTAKQFRAAVETLKEQGFIVEIATSIEHTYYPVAEREE